VADAASTARSVQTWKPWKGGKMKYVAIFAVLVLLTVNVGCAQKEQVKGTFLSDPPGGTLYKQNGEVWGACQKTL
jgi:hypothetical protein